MTVVVDTDALLALADVHDAHHAHAQELTHKLIEKDAVIVLAPTTLSEFALLCAKRIGIGVAKRLVQGMLEDYTVFELDYALLVEASQLYDKQTSLAESLFDCVVMAVARKIKADAIFSFDKGYVKNGFTLIDSIGL